MGNTISQYANRTCNCPECRPSARRVPVQQTRRDMPRRRQVPDRQINVPNPEEWFHQQNQTAKEPRKKSRKPQKTVRKQKNGFTSKTKLRRNHEKNHENHKKRSENRFKIRLALKFQQRSPKNCHQSQ